VTFAQSRRSSSGLSQETMTRLKEKERLCGKAERVGKSERLSVGGIARVFPSGRK